MFENGYRFFYTQKVTYSNPLTAPNVATQSSIVAYSYSLPCHIHSTDGRFEFQVTFLGDNFKYSDTYRANGNYFTRPRFHQVSEISQLLTSINNGASVKVCVENQYFELHNVSVDSATVSGMSVWEMRDKNDGRSFNDTFQRVYRIFNQRLTENSMEGASYKWYTTEQQSYERRTNLNLTWFVDTCWDVVYENNRDGIAVSESSATLLAAVRAGKRIKVRIGQTFHQANFITISTDDVLTIQVLDSMNDNLQDPTWQWLFVSTSGKVTTVRHKIGDKNAISAKTDDTVALTWFVELRDWSNGSGESQRITDAIIAGSDLRYMIVDASGNQLYYEAEYYYTDLWFLNRRELVEKSGIFYQRHSLFAYPSYYSFSDWKVENVDDRQGPKIKVPGLTCRVPCSSECSLLVAEVKQC